MNLNQHRLSIHFPLPDLLRSVILIMLLSATKTIFSQQLNTILLEPLDEKNGMSNNWITNMALDSAGYLWIGTQDGLNRYDGYSFKVFKHDEKNPASLLHNNGQKINVNKNGDVWISYYEGGFSLYNKDSQCFTHYTSPFTKPAIPTDKAFGIQFIDKNGDIWFSGQGLGLNKYVYRKDKLIHLDLPISPDTNSSILKMNTNTVNSIYEDTDGLLWLCTAKGLYSFNPLTNSFSYKKYTLEKKVLDLKYNFTKIIPEGKVGFWIASFDGGINYFDLKKETFTNYRFEFKSFGYYNLVHDMAPKNQHEIWLVSGDKGLGIFNKITGTFEFKSDHTNSDGSKFSFLRQIIVTPAKELFILDETTLLKYSPSAKLFEFTYLPIASSQHGNLHVIRKILENPERKEIYFAVEYGNGLNILNTETTKLTALGVDVDESKDKRMRLSGLIKDSNGMMWLMSRDHLYEFDPGRKKLIKIQHPFMSGKPANTFDFKIFIQDMHGEIWVRTSDGNLYPFSGSAKKSGGKLIVEDGQNNIQNIDYALFDSHNTFWILGDHAIAYRKKAQLKFNFIRSDELTNLLNYEIKAAVADSYGNIWIAIYDQGLLKIKISDSNKITYHLFKPPFEIPNSRINNMGIDPNDNIWMSTINGVVYFNPRHNSYKLFNQIQGMDKYIHGMRFIKAGPHSFYITTPGKYCKVDLNQLDKTPAPPKVYIDRINIGKKQIPPSSELQKELVLKPAENFFSFDFGSIDFTNQAYHHFSYQLEGWDKDWQECGTRRFANYTNVSPGKYTFKVKVRNGEGQWSHTAMYKINIQTPFNKSWWFRILIGLIISSILVGIYRYRLAQQRQVYQLKGKTDILEKEKTMIMYESLKQQLNPHFLFNSLTSLSGLIELDQAMAGEFLEQMSGIYRYILTYGNTETIALNDELEFVNLYIKLQQTRFKDGLEVRIDVPEEYRQSKIAPVTLQNLIENAIKHNVIDKDSPLLIEIFIADDCIVVRNNLQKKNKVETSNKKGLAQFVTLYKYLSHKEVVIEETNTHFVIKIPLI